MDYEEVIHETHHLCLGSRSSSATIFLDEPAPPEDGRYATVYGKPRLTPGASPDHRVGGAPSGRYEPVSGFGLFWRNEAETNAPNFDNLRGRLGWALEPDRAADFTRQCELNQTIHAWLYFVCYISLPDGRVLRLHPDSTARLNYFWREWRGQ